MCANEAGVPPHTSLPPTRSVFGSLRGHALPDKLMDIRVLRVKLLTYSIRTTQGVSWLTKLYHSLEMRSTRGVIQWG